MNHESLTAIDRDELAIVALDRMRWIERTALAFIYGLPGHAGSDGTIHSVKRTAEILHKQEETIEKAKREGLEKLGAVLDLEPVAAGRHLFRMGTRSALRSQRISNTVLPFVVDPRCAEEPCRVEPFWEAVRDRFFAWNEAKNPVDMRSVARWMRDEFMPWMAGIHFYPIERPTEPGWFWYEWPTVDRRIILLCVIRAESDGALLVSLGDREIPLLGYTGRWFGPKIPQPKLSHDLHSESPGARVPAQDASDRGTTGQADRRNRGTPKGKGRGSRSSRPKAGGS